MSVTELKWQPTLSAGPGTYVVIFRLTTPVRDLAIGQLGRFNFPAGFYPYVGSAFGAGGVKARTDRHLTQHTTKRWNIDYLKAFASPVEVWWTNDRMKRECAWADLVGGLPGASVPAPMFGARDCKRCAAHLYRFGRWPGFEAFATAVAARLEGHGPVYRSMVRSAGGDETG